MSRILISITQWTIVPFVKTGTQDANRHDWRDNDFCLEHAEFEVSF